ncbi:MAG TPA: hypothetical protein VFM18_20030 [Methanosarcina sp.]|nr:hypothetical protein [Methanosarcina sp.]
MTLVELFGFDELDEATQLRLIDNYQPGKQAKREKGSCELQMRDVCSSFDLSRGTSV